METENKKTLQLKDFYRKNIGNKDRDVQIIQDYLKDEITVKQIAEKFSLSTTAIYNILNKYRKEEQNLEIYDQLVNQKGEKEIQIN